MVCLETSVKKTYQSTMREVPEERRSHLCGGGGSLKSHIFDITSIGLYLVTSCKQVTAGARLRNYVFTTFS
jgi:hypothetical protein